MLCFSIKPSQIDYSSYLVEYELLYRTTTDLSMTSETKLKDTALSSCKLLNDDCKYENNLSSEELSSLKTLVKYKNILIHKAGKGNTVVIIDKEKYIQDVKNAISGSSEFIPLNIPAEEILLIYC